MALTKTAPITFEKYWQKHDDFYTKYTTVRINALNMQISRDKTKSLPSTVRVSGIS